jgi:hypothetical protein
MARPLIFQPMSLGPRRQSEASVDRGGDLDRLRDPAAYDPERLYAFLNDETGARYGGLNAQEVVELWCVDTRTYILAFVGGMIELRTSSGDGVYLPLEASPETARRYTFDQAAQALALDGDGVQPDPMPGDRAKALSHAYAAAQRDWVAALVDQAAGVIKRPDGWEIAQDRLDLMADVLDRNGLPLQAIPEFEALQSLHARHSADQDVDEAAKSSRHKLEILELGRAHGYFPGRSGAL